MQILLATRNKGKIEEMTAVLAPLSLQIETLDSLGVTSGFEEIGVSFKASALLKASYYYNATKIPTLAEDSGLAVDALHGEPGIKSRRWPGYEASDGELMQLLLSRLDGVPPPRRTAHFISAVCYVHNSGRNYTAEHKVDGYILEQPVPPIQAGVPWSAVFYVSAAGKVFSQMTVHEKNTLSHRGGAMKKIMPFIARHLQYARH